MKKVNSAWGRVDPSTKRRLQAAERAAEAMRARIASGERRFSDGFPGYGD